MQKKLNTEEIRQKAEEELQFLLEDSRQHPTDEEVERQATKDEIKEDETLNDNLIYETGEFFPECDDIGHYEGSEDVPSFVPVEEADLWRCNRKTKEWHKGSDKF